MNEIAHFFEQHGAYRIFILRAISSRASRSPKKELSARKKAPETSPPRKPSLTCKQH